MQSIGFRRFFCVYYVLLTEATDCQILLSSPVFPAFFKTIPAVFTVKVTAKKNGKKVSKTLASNITVKDYKVRLVDATGATVSGTTIAVVGTPVQFTAKTAPAKATVTYTSSDSAIATVDATGKVTPVKTGKVTITAATDKASTTAEVEVKNYALGTVSQTKLTELTATVAGNTKNLKPTDFVVKNETTNVVYPVSKVSVDSKDASKVTLTLFSEAKDAATYDVTLDEITKTFVASDGKVAYTKQDASKYDFTLTTNNGYVNGTKLYLNKIADTATAEITYKSGKYDQNGKAEGNVTSGKVTITAVDQSAASNFDVRIDDGNKSYDKAKDDKKIAAKDTKTAYFMIKNADGKEISDYNNYSVESSDPATLMVGTQNDISSKKVSVTGVKEGTAYLLIKKDSKVVGSVAITVVAEKAVATLELDKYNVTLSNVIRRSADVNVTLKDQYGNDVTSAYANDINVENLTKPSKAAGNKFSKTGAKITFAPGDVAGDYTFKISYKKDGKEVVARTIVVSVKDTTATKANSWKLNITNDNVDIKADKDNYTDKVVKAEVIGSADGADLYSLTNVKYVVKKADGTVLFSTVSGTTPAKAPEAGVFTVTTNGALSIKVSGQSQPSYPANGVTNYVITKYLEAGTYTVYAEGVDNVDSSVTAKITTTFTVKDTQAKATAEVKANSVDARATTGSAVDAVLGDSVIVKYGDYTYTDRTDYTDAHAGLEVCSIEGTKNNGSSIVYNNNAATVIGKGEGFTVTKVTVWVNVGTDDVPVWLAVEVPDITGYFSVNK